MKYLSDWQIKTLVYKKDFIDLESLEDLANNKVGAIKISNLYSPNELEQILSGISSNDICWYPDAEGKQGRIGLSVTEYCSKIGGKLDYFNNVIDAVNKRKDIFSKVLNPIDKIMGAFSQKLNPQIALEQGMDNCPYFSGLMRIMGVESTLHYDYAPNQVNDWWISDLDEQFGAILYLQMPLSGGGLKIYNHPWVIEDEKFNNDKIEKGPFGFDSSFLENETSINVMPSAGDLIVFRTKNFHEVEKMVLDENKYRITVGSFIALKDNQIYFYN